MSELKPCPFCGPDRSVCAAAKHYALWQIICGACGSASGFRGTEAEAIALWNTRADSLALAAAVQAEREAVLSEIEKEVGWLIGEHRRFMGDALHKIRSRGPAPAVDVIGIVRELFSVLDAHREAFKKDDDDAMHATAIELEKVEHALRSITLGAVTRDDDRPCPHDNGIGDDRCPDCVDEAVSLSLQEMRGECPPVPGAAANDKGEGR